MSAVGLSLCALLVSHNASQGKSRFDISHDGTVDVEVQLSAIDLPELCNVDLSVRDRATQETRLDECVLRGFPYWLMIKDGTHPCALESKGWRELEPHTVPPVIAMNARAQCGADVATLVIDWGLFAGSPLDHTSVARVLLPGRDAQMFAFSKRARKLTVEVSRGLSAWFVGVGGVLVLVAAFAGVLIGRRRARG